MITKTVKLLKYVLVVSQINRMNAKNTKIQTSNFRTKYAIQSYFAFLDLKEELNAATKTV